MSLATLKQEQPTNSPEATPTTEGQDNTYSEPTPEENTPTSEPAQENTAGGEESPPPTIGDAIIVEQGPSEGPEDDVTSVRDGSEDQTAFPPTPAPAPSTAEQPKETATPAEQEVGNPVEANTAQTDANVLVESQQKQIENTSTTDWLGSAMIAGSGIIAVGVGAFRRFRPFRRQKKN